MEANFFQNMSKKTTMTEKGLHTQKSEQKENFVSENGEALKVARTTCPTELVEETLGVRIASSSQS